MSSAADGESMVKAVMKRTATFVLGVDRIDRRIRLALVASLGVGIPFLGLPQWATGPLVNALLLVTYLTCGLSDALVVGLVTPASALLRGVLPLPLAAMIPFIALGNASYVAVFHALHSRSRCGALGAAAGAKFAVLSLAVGALVAAAPPALVPTPDLTPMMRLPQLYSALAGGLWALGGASLFAWVHDRGHG